MLSSIYAHILTIAESVQHSFPCISYILDIRYHALGFRYRSRNLEHRIFPCESFTRAWPSRLFARVCFLYLAYVWNDANIVLQEVQEDRSRGERPEGEQAQTLGIACGGHTGDQAGLSNTGTGNRGDPDEKDNGTSVE